MTQRIKLMAEYVAFPLWWNDRMQAGDIDPRSLPLSEELLDRLERWRDRYDKQMNYAEPYDSIFFNEEERQSFDEEGMQLWSALREELGPSYEVSYHSRLQRRLLTPSDIES